MLKYARFLIISAVLATCPALALAHSKINTTVPENEAVLAEAPPTIELKFAKKIRLTKITARIGEEDSVEMDLSKHKGFENHFSLQNDLQDKGLYTIEWRGLSVDGHVMKGILTFTVE